MAAQIENPLPDDKLQANVMKSDDMAGAAEAMEAAEALTGYPILKRLEVTEGLRSEDVREPPDGRPLKSEVGTDEGDQAGAYTVPGVTTEPDNHQHDLNAELEVTGPQSIHRSCVGAELIFDPQAFVHLVHEVVTDLNARDLKWQMSALYALQETAELYMVQKFEDASLFALLENRNTVLAMDLERAVNMQRTQNSTASDNTASGSDHPIGGCN